MTAKPRLDEDPDRREAAHAGWRRVAFGALAILRRLVDAILVCLLAAMIFLILFQILGRYVFNYSISWSEEAAIFVQIWLVMLGAGLAMRNRNHIGIDLVVARLPGSLQWILKSASFLLAAWFLLVLVVGSFGLIGLGMIIKSTALQLPMAIPYAALPIGMSYLLLEFALATLPELAPGRAKAGAERPAPTMGE
ncbi:TRAP transporter small permease [Salinarimonas ramus]|uniref:TRAP transporter small permease protein n=1 Tax=Salinarimonas ramus TaxID=690164 RepID=A0A917QHQ7_9HYPH|nr:TRAP transporter small permease [Salinarimonas ramus]GGK50997.1 C4-dicarboxylate ABC transporter [Salinarimonas ramus]